MPFDDDVLVTILEQQGSTVLVRVVSAAGSGEILGEIEWTNHHLTIYGAHIGGLSPGALGRRGLNKIARKFMEDADVDTLHIYGAKRSTGRNAGRPPKLFRATRRTEPAP